MVSLCKYKNLFGEPGTGIHSIRMFGVGMIDVLTVLIAGWLISYIWKLNIYLVLAVLFISGIIIHRLFCVRTTVDKFLFPNAK